jgi:hypothetical protein
VASSVFMMISLVEGNHVNAGFTETGSSTGETLHYLVSSSDEGGRMRKCLWSCGG